MASENLQHAQDLVDEFPERAAWLIATECQYRNIVETLAQARNRNRRKSSSAGASSVESQQSVSPPNNQRFLPHTPRASRSALPPSPAQTPSTGQSPRPNAQMEYVLVIVDAPADGQPQECKLSMVTAPVPHSLIREDIVHTRLYNRASVNPVPNAPISLVYPGTPSTFLLSSRQVTLTWRRPRSLRTHQTLFYLVPDEIDVDIILGYPDSGRGIFPAEIRAPNPQRPRRDPVLPAMYPPPPDLRAPPSHHPSSALSHGSNNTTPVPPVVHDIFNRGHGPAAGFNGQSGHYSPTPTEIHRSRPSSRRDSHAPRQYATGASSPLSTMHQQSPFADEIRVEFAWDNARINVKLDLNVPGEAFFNAVAHTLQRRFQKTLDRSTHTILFTTDKRADGAAEYSLSLEESDLREDWADAVDWIKEHVTTDPPRLYAVIQYDGG